MTLPETIYLEKLQEENLRIVLKERSGSLCEICGKGYSLVLHHIGGRGKPYKSWPEEIREDWPHCELNAIIICHGAHGSSDRSGRVHSALRHNEGPLWAWLEVKYGKALYKGKAYAEWFAGPGPWRREERC